MALATGLAAAPSNAAVPATAQETHAAQASAVKTSASPSAASSQSTSSEEQEIEGFLHAPAVRSLARSLHLSLNTTDNILLGLNFGILALAIAIPLIRITPRIIRRRTMTLRHNLASAQKLTQDARARLSAVEAQLAKLGDEIQQLRGTMEEEIKEDEARIRTSMEEERTRIVAEAEQEINLAGIQARRGLRRYAAELAVQHASEQVALSPETDRALIAEFAASLTQDRGDGAQKKSGAGGKN
jgi:F-type H+-transporting ATPase subunit b